MKPSATPLAVWILGYLVVPACSWLPAARGQERGPAERGGASAGRRPNIILIVVDDQAPNTLGIEGNAAVRTPRLDRLAREGAYFSRAYVPCPQCAPSRAALLTGLYPHQNGVVRNEGARLRAEAVTFPQLFKKAGYACGLVGKWGIGDQDRPLAGFDHFWVPMNAFRRSAALKTGRRGTDVPREEHFTEAITDRAIGFVQEHADGPFLLWVGYKAPHRPYLTGDSPFAYDAEDMPLPKSMADNLSTKPAVQRESAMHRRFRQSTPDKIQEQLSLYYALISSVDHNVGRLVDTLADLQLDQRTVIVYMSDNGVLHGEHQLLNKGPVLYEELVRSPMIMWCPGRITPGTRVNALVGSLDLFPTLCRLGDIPVPSGLPGRDLWPVLTRPSTAVHEVLFFEYQHKETTDEPVPIRGLVTAKYKYARYLGDGEELYDLQADPHEMRNLAEDPGHEELRNGLRRKLAVWRKQTGDVP